MCIYDKKKMKTRSIKANKPLVENKTVIDIKL